MNADNIYANTIIVTCIGEERGCNCVRKAFMLYRAFQSVVVNVYSMGYNAGWQHNMENLSSRTGKTSASQN